MRLHKHIRTIESTNTYLKERYSEFPDMFAVSCEFQTKGRGRQNRVWEDNEGKNLIVSLIFKPKKEIVISQIPLVFCAAVFKFLKKYVDNVKIKWPNDILLNGKKLCGILVESSFSNRLNYIIVGIGINVNSTMFSK